jgi:hypothetical protein
MWAVASYCVFIGLLAVWPVFSEKYIGELLAGAAFLLAILSVAYFRLRCDWEGLQSKVNHSAAQIEEMRVLVAEASKQIAYAS